MKKIIALLVVSLFGAVAMLSSAGAAKKPKKPKFVGAQKCDSSCHDPWYKAWTETGHAKTFKLLMPGERAEAKKKAGLDPNKDYTKDSLCLRCHTTGFRQRGGYKKGDPPDDPTEPNKAAVGCEMCHSVMGGAMFRVTMKEKKEKFTRLETEADGMRYDFANVCKRCHEHPNTPFQPSVDPKYKFDFEDRKKRVHQVDKFYNADNKDQVVTKDASGKSVHGVGKTEKTPYPIEEWEIVNGKLKKKVWAKWDKKAKKVIWKKR
ncbi:MAG: cytochrome c family protein [Nitrospinota bacterium]